MKQKKSKNAETSVSNELEPYLRVLGYKKDRYTWAAHCLETDLVGYGKTFKIALDNLIELTEMQIGFAIYKDEPALLDCPAPIEIIEVYNNLIRSNLHYFAQRNKVDHKHKATCIPLPNLPLKSDFTFAHMQAS